MYKFAKNAGLFFGGIVINGSCMHQAVNANNKWNSYLANLPKDELEKLKARDWHIKKTDAFFGSGGGAAGVLLDRALLGKFNALPEREKESILTQYRWANLKATPESSYNGLDVVDAAITTKPKFG